MVILAVKRKYEPKSQNVFEFQDPGVPNSCPFKEDVLKEVAAGRQRKQEMRDKKRDEMKQRREEAKEKALEEKRTKVSIVYLNFEWHKNQTIFISQSI